jgi:hypothetical protein
MRLSTRQMPEWQPFAEVADNHFKLGIFIEQAAAIKRSA